MTRPLNRLAPHQPPAATDKYRPRPLFGDTMRRGAAAAKQPPATAKTTLPSLPPNSQPPPPLLSGHKTSWSGLSPGATAASRAPLPPPPLVPGPTPTPIGEMCVFQVSKYCHLPESSMASPFRVGVYWPCLPCNRGAHVASRSNPDRRMGQGNFSRHSWSQQLKHTYMAHLHFPRLGKPFPAFISSATKGRLHVPVGSHHTRSADPWVFSVSFFFFYSALPKI